MKNYKVTVLHLKEFTKKVFAMTGLTEVDADSVAELLVHADARGVSSHGVLRMEPDRED